MYHASATLDAGHWSLIRASCLAVRDPKLSHGLAPKGGRRNRNADAQYHSKGIIGMEVFEREREVMILGMIISITNIKLHRNMGTVYTSTKGSMRVCANRGH